MLRPYFAVCVVVAGLTGLGVRSAMSQEYPSRPIRIITSPAGGGNDFVARLVARAISGSLGQQAVVDNRPTVLIADIVPGAADGYTVLITGSAPGSALSKRRRRFDKGFAAITVLDRRRARSW